MSQYGSGVVVCLLKFSEHLNDRWAGELKQALNWQNMNPRHREAELLTQPEKWEKLMARLDHEDIEKVVNWCATIWAQGASDHLAALDMSKAPANLIELRTRLMKMRWSEFETFTREDWQEIRQLYKEAAMDIDEHIIGTEPEWGDWS
jgi:hypothetical protein